MIKKYGDIWTCEPLDAWVVVPTNVGWKRNGENVMGAGLAKQASVRFSGLAKLYGAWCKKNGDALYVSKKHKVMCLPSKPLDYNKPWASWNQPADSSTVINSYLQLKEWVENNPNENVKTPLLGAGLGGLDQLEAEALINVCELPDNVILVIKM